MSVYDYFDYHDCCQFIWLGKALQDNYKPYCFPTGAEATPHGKRELLHQVLWKFLADHTGHRIDIRLKRERTDERFGFQEIGGGREGVLCFEALVRGWRGCGTVR